MIIHIRQEEKIYYVCIAILRQLGKAWQHNLPLLYITYSSSYCCILDTHPSHNACLYTCVYIFSPSNVKICHCDQDTLVVMLWGDTTFHSAAAFAVCYRNTSILLLGGFESLGHPLFLLCAPVTQELILPLQITGGKMSAISSRTHSPQQPMTCSSAQGSVCSLFLLQAIWTRSQHYRCLCSGIYVVIKSEHQLSPSPGEQLQNSWLQSAIYEVFW